MATSKEQQAYETAKYAVTIVRINALNEIENLAEFDLSADTMRSEIKRIMKEYKEECKRLMHGYQQG
jgi:hypothetical protein